MRVQQHQPQHQFSATPPGGSAPVRMHTLNPISTHSILEAAAAAQQAQLEQQQIQQQQQQLQQQDEAAVG
jgi:hypothetical protein